MSYTEEQLAEIRGDLEGLIADHLTRFPLDLDNNETRLITFRRSDESPNRIVVGVVPSLLGDDEALENTAVRLGWGTHLRNDQVALAEKEAEIAAAKASLVKPDNPLNVTQDDINALQKQKIEIENTPVPNPVGMREFLMGLMNAVIKNQLADRESISKATEDAAEAAKRQATAEQEQAVNAMFSSTVGVFETA